MSELTQYFKRYQGATKGTFPFEPQKKTFFPFGNIFFFSKAIIFKKIEWFKVYGIDKNCRKDLKNIPG